MAKIPEWVERSLWKSLISPVIIKVKSEKFNEAIEWIKTEVLDNSVVGKIIKRIVTPERIKEIEKHIITMKFFNYVALPLPREFVFALESENFVDKIFYDYEVNPLTIPTVQEEGVFNFVIAKKYKVKGTTTYWTKKILGAYDANIKGFYGYGVTVSVCDTGCFPLPGIEKVKLRKVVGVIDIDVANGHGCVVPGTRVFLANPGIVKIEELYESIDTDEIITNAGISKKVEKDLYVYTVSENGEIVKDRVLYVHKLQYNGDVYRIRLRSGIELVLTPWHPLMCLDDNGKIIYKRADEIKEHDCIVAVKKNRNIFDSKVLFLPVVNITKEKYDGVMYDITTEKYNTYIADGVVVHNTWCCSAICSRHVVDERLSRIIGKVVPVEGMAPGVECYSVKCLEMFGGRTSWVIKAIEDSVFKYNADVISMSLGGPLEAEKPEDDPCYHPLKICKDLRKIACVASGNEGKGRLCSPGSLPVVLRVGAYDPVKGKIAKFTSRGVTPWGEIVPDIVMPGVWVYAHATGECDMIDSYLTGFSALSGTSMAAPHASGMIALMKEAHRKLLGKELTLDEVILMMTELGEYKEKSEDYGFGVLTWRKYEEWLSTQYGVEV